MPMPWTMRTSSKLFKTALSKKSSSSCKASEAESPMRLTSLGTTGRSCKLRMTSTRSFFSCFFRAKKSSFILQRTCMKPLCTCASPLL